MFYSCASLTSLNASGWDTSAVTNMGGMFYNCSGLTSLDVSGWDTSAVTNINSMFYNCTSLTSLNVSGWDTSAVKHMTYMFYNCTSLTSLNASGWDTSAVTSMYSIFDNCSGLTSLDVSDWDTSAVTDMSNMFSNCASLTSLDVSDWDTSAVTDMYSMFYNCSGLTSLDVSGWNTSAVKHIYSMFYNCSGLTSLDVSGWNTSAVTNMSGMFDSCSRLQKVVLGKDFKFVGTDGYLPTPSSTYFSGATGKWKNTAGKKFAPSEIPNNVADTYTVDIAAYAILYSPSGNISSNDGELVFQSGSTPDSSKGTVVATYTGFETETYTLSTIPWKNYNSNIKTVTFKTVIQPISTAYWFCNFTNLSAINTEKLDTSTVTDMKRMFDGCSSLTSLDVRNWNTSAVTNMEGMFDSCSGLTSLNVSGWNTSAVIIMDYMFDGCSGLTSLDVSNWNTSAVIIMDYMFDSCSSLTSLDVSNWNTSAVTDMNYMFRGCSGLTSLDVSNWNTSAVTDMNYMFRGCSGLTSLDVSGWNTSTVTNMRYMFAGCIKLQKVVLGKDFKFVGTKGYLPTPDSTYFPGTTGKWKNTAGKTFAPSEIPNNIADTYVVDIVNYQIAFNANGGSDSMSNQSFAYGESKALTANAFTRTGYSFSGWKTSGGTAYADKATVSNLTETDGAVITLYAQWSPVSYSISYVMNGGSMSGQKTSYTIETDAFTLPTPTRTGYSFTGWTGTGLSSATKSVSVAKGSTGNRSYTANWSADSYSITYNLDGGSISGQPTSYSIETATFTLPTPSKTGYSFAGWTGTGLSSATKSVSVAKGSTGNRSYTATWTPVNYSITYNLDGGSLSGQKTSYTIETDTFTLPTPSKTGYTFNGWTGSNGSTAQKTVSIAKGSTGNKTYTASWTVNNYVLDLNGNLDGSEPGNISGYGTADVYINGALVGDDVTDWCSEYPYGTKYEIKDIKAAAGHTYNGVKEGDVALSGTIGAARVSVTLKFTTNKYTVAYNANGGSGSMATDTVTYGTDYTAKVNAFTRTGYTFAGWNESADGKGSSWTSWIGKPWTWAYTKNITLYAQWTKDTYSISYDLDGGSISGQKTSYDVETDTFTLPTPSKAGYTFVGWTGSNGSTAQKSVSIAKGSTGNKTYTANWSINQYTLTITGDDGVESITGTGKYNYGATAIVTYKIKAGYHIVNTAGTTSTGSQGTWTDRAGREGTVSDDWGIEACDRNIKVNTAPNTYTVKYDGNTATSGSTADSSHTYDAAKALTANSFTKTGYTFKNWNTAADGSGTVYADSASVKNLTAANGGTVTLYAQWTPNILTVQFHADGAVKYDSNGDGVEDLDVSGKDIVANGFFAYDLSDENAKKYGLTDSDRLQKYGYHCNNTWVVGKGGTVKVDAAKTFSTAQDLAKLCGVTAQLEKGNVTVDLYPDWQINTGTVHYYPNADDVTTTIDGKILVTNGGFAGSAQETTTFDYNTKGGAGANTLSDVGYVFKRKGYHEDIAHNWRYGSPDSGTYFHADEEDLSPYVKDATDVHLKLYANWIANPYTVKFDGNGADSGNIQDISGTYDTAFTLPKNSFVRSCYEFTGWNTAKDGSGTAYTDQESVKNLTDAYYGTVTLYAQWKLSTYNVIFDKNNGTGSMENQVLTFDKEEALSANTYLRAGYSFTGWNTQADGKGTAYTDQQKVTNLSADGSDVTLYAQWKPYVLTIHYHNDGAQKWQQYPDDTTIDVSNMDIVQTEMVAYDAVYNHAENGLLDADRFTRTGYHTTGYWKIGSKTGQPVSYADGSITGDKGQDVAKVLGVDTQLVNSDVTVDLYPVWEIDKYSLTISNTVSGSMGNKAKDFAFSVKLSNSNPDGVIPSRLAAVFTDENGKETEKELAVSNGTVTVELSHKQSVTLKGIPYGTAYTVTETNGDGYDITRTNDSGTITKDVSVSFTNTKNGTVPTSADAPVPYPLMAMAFIGAAILVVGKKKKEKVK